MQALVISSQNRLKKLQQLRTLMLENQLDVYYIAPEDEHLNEYLPEHHQRILWLTGFTGENATALVTNDKIYLFVDGRFHLQVDYEVDPTLVTAVKLGQPNTATLAETIQQLAKSQALKIGYAPLTITPKSMEHLLAKLKFADITWFAIDHNLVDIAWSDIIPARPIKPLFVLDTQITGESVEDKLLAVRKQMQKHHVDVLPIVRLDEIAWLLNIRGHDIAYNLVLESYVLLTHNSCSFYVRPEALTLAAKDILEKQGISIYNYENFLDDIEDILQIISSPHSPLQTEKNNARGQYWLDTNSITIGVMDTLSKSLTPYKAMSPVMALKAIKNKAEIDGMRFANKQASIAIIEHMAWAHEKFKTGHALNEVNLRADIEQRYSEKSGFAGLSFPTIPGLNTHSAIIHYCEADENEFAKDSGWYLLDSGAHYNNGHIAGTTDTTRTTVFGQPTPEQTEKYTAVLKAHINCAMQSFPKGTTGAQLDAICRAPLWNLNLNFGHGTGHGVGAFLNVHEGPNRISSVCDVKFEPGMITSNEPGYYQANWGGIRLENLYVVCDSNEKASDDQPVYKFESLTLAPFEKKLIDFKMLNQCEMAWLKSFYQHIETEVMPEVSQDAKSWLKEQLTME